MKFTNTLIWPKDVPFTKNRKTRRTKQTWLMAKTKLQGIAKKTGIQILEITGNLNIINDNIHSYRNSNTGISVIYFSKASQVKKIAYCDRYMKACDNLLAIAESISDHYDINMRGAHFKNFTTINT